MTASLSLTIVIAAPAATSVTLTPVAPFTASGNTVTAASPVASGATVGNITVQPAGWQGTLTLSGTDAAKFSISGMNLLTAVALPVGSYNVVINANDGGGGTVKPSAPTGLKANPQ